MSRLSLSVFYSCEVVPFISPFCFPQPSVSAFCLLLLPFLLSEPSAHECSSSLLARAPHECFCSFLLLFPSAFFPSSYEPSPLPLVHGRWGWVHDITCGNCHTILRELSTMPPPHPLRTQSRNESPQPPYSHRKHLVTLFCTVPRLQEVPCLAGHTEHQAP